VTVKKGGLAWGGGRWGLRRELGRRVLGSRDKGRGWGGEVVPNLQDEELGLPWVFFRCVGPPPHRPCLRPSNGSLP